MCMNENGTIPCDNQLKAIMVNGAPLPGFNPIVNEYTIGTAGTFIPEVTAVPYSAQAVCNITRNPVRIDYTSHIQVKMAKLFAGIRFSLSSRNWKLWRLSNRNRSRSL